MTEWSARLDVVSVLVFGNATGGRCCNAREYVVLGLCLSMIIV